MFGGGEERLEREGPVASEGDEEERKRKRDTVCPSRAKGPTSGHNAYVVYD
jgi:hypothetical protein